nr:hypothetical protein [Blautia argi]
MRLLLAEDEKALSKALVAILERNNYSVDAVYDGQSALDYLEMDNYDGVIFRHYDAQGRWPYCIKKSQGKGKSHPDSIIDSKIRSR